MLPLDHPADFWRKLKHSTSIYLWNKKKPRIKASTCKYINQRVMLTYLTFNGMRGVLPCVHSHVLVNSASQVSWRPIEERLTQPYNLTNVIYSNIPQKIVKRDFAPIITYIFMVWYKVNKLAKTDKFFCQSPVFHNYSLLIDGKPIIFPQWSDKGVHSIQDIMGLQGITWV